MVSGRESVFGNKKEKSQEGGEKGSKRETAKGGGN